MGFSHIVSASSKLPKDPEFVDELRDIVGLYLDPPATPSSCPSTKRARSRPSTARLADEEGRAGTMTCV
jgi:hypothetical protein